MRNDEGDPHGYGAWRSNNALTDEAVYRHHTFSSIQLDRCVVNHLSVVGDHVTKGDGYWDRFRGAVLTGLAQMSPDARRVILGLLTDHDMTKQASTVFWNVFKSGLAVARAARR